MTSPIDEIPKEPYGVVLWDKIDVVVQKLRRNAACMEHIKRYLEERADIELDYSKRLLKLSTKFFQNDDHSTTTVLDSPKLKNKVILPPPKKVNEFTPEIAMHQFVGLDRLTALQHEQIAEFLKSFKFYEIDSFIEKTKTTVSNAESEYTKMERLYKTRLNDLTTAFQSFYSSTVEMKKSNNIYKAADVDGNLSRNQVSELYRKALVKYQESWECQSIYIKHLKEFNLFHVNHFTESLPSLFAPLESLDKNFHTEVYSLLSNYAGQFLGLQAAFQVTPNEVESILEIFCWEKDRQHFVSENWTGLRPPKLRSIVRFEAPCPTRSPSIMKKNRNAIQNGGNATEDQFLKFQGSFYNKSGDKKDFIFPPAQRLRYLTQTMQRLCEELLSITKPAFVEINLSDSVASDISALSNTSSISEKEKQYQEIQDQIADLKIQVSEARQVLQKSWWNFKHSDWEKELSDLEGDLRSTLANDVIGFTGWPPLPPAPAHIENLCVALCDYSPEQPQLEGLDRQLSPLLSFRAGQVFRLNVFEGRSDPDQFDWLEVETMEATPNKGLVPKTYVSRRS